MDGDYEVRVFLLRLIEVRIACKLRPSWGPLQIVVCLPAACTTMLPGAAAVTVSLPYLHRLTPPG